MPDEVPGWFDPLSVLSSGSRTSSLLFPEAFGAKGDGSDDSAALQAAINAARSGTASRTLVWGGNYTITSGMTGYPSSGSVVMLNIIFLPGAGLNWAGGSGTPAAYAAMFRSLGLKFSTWYGCLNVTYATPNAARNVVTFDIDVDGTHASSSFNNFGNVLINLNGTNAGGATANGCIGWRLGHSGTTDMSFNVWERAGVFGYAQGTGVAVGAIGWVWENQNCVSWTWRNCYCAALWKDWSAAVTTGAADVGGGASMLWDNCGSSQNNTTFANFELTTPGSYVWESGRYETGGNQFIHTSGSGAPAYNVTCNGTIIQGYNVGNVLFWFQNAVNVTLLGMTVNENVGGNWGNNFMAFEQGAAGYSTATIEDCDIQTSAALPTAALWQIGNGTTQSQVKVRLSNNRATDVNQNTLGHLTDGWWRGTNPMQGTTAAMVAGSVTVANTSILATDRILYSRRAAGGALGHLSSSVTAATSFTITSSSNTETSTVDYQVIPA